MNKGTHKFDTLQQQLVKLFMYEYFDYIVIPRAL